MLKKKITYSWAVSGTTTVSKYRAAAGAADNIRCVLRHVLLRTERGRPVKLGAPGPMCVLV